MKIILAAVLLAGSIQSLFAVEYVTLSKSSPTAVTSPNALVEIVGFSGWLGTFSGTYGLMLEVSLGSGDKFDSPLSGGKIATGSSPAYAFQASILNQKFTNVTLVRIHHNSSTTFQDVVTLKITPASEINSAGPTSVLVIPENTEGDHDVVIESSSDMVTWTPMHSQTVVGNAPSKFFRTRIVKR